jgi:signal transduction histidine kinase
MALGLFLLSLPPLAARSLPQARIDSLRHLLAQHTDADTQRLRLWNQLSIAYRQGAHYDSARAVAERQRALARRLEDLRGRADALHQLGLLASAQAEFVQAFEYFGQSLDLKETLGDREGTANTLHNVGNLHARQGAYAQAEEYYQRSLGIRAEIGDRSGSAATLNNLGGIHRAQGDFEEAVGYYRRSLAIFEQDGNRAHQAATLNNLGIIFSDQGEYDRALRHYRRSLEVFQQTGDQAKRAAALGNIGLVYWHQGNYPRALDYYRRSLRLSESLGDLGRVANTLSNIGNLYAEQHAYGEALDYYRRSLETNERIGNRAGLVPTRINIGNVYRNQGAYQQALQAYQQGRERAQSIGDAPQLVYADLNTGETYFELDQPLRAKEYLQKAIDRADALGMRAEAAQARSLLARALLAEDRAVEAYPLARQALDSAQAAGRIDFIRDAAYVGYQVLEKMGRPTEALRTYKLFVRMRDSLKSEENQRATIRLEYQHQYQRQALEDSLAFVRQQEVKDLEIRNQQAALQQQRWAIAGASGGALALGVLTLVLVQTNRKRRQAYRLVLEQKNRMQKQAEELQELNALVSQQNERLQGLNTLKDKLFSVISHDMRQPMNHLDSVLELARDDVFSDSELKEVLQSIQPTFRATNEMLHNLLHWARTQLKGASLYPKAFNLSDAAQKAVKLFEPQRELKNLRLYPDFPPDLYAYADEQAAQLVLRNLLGNAMKFTPKGGHISLRIRTEGQFVRVEVRDSGQGVPPRLRETLFHSEGHSTVGTAGEKGTGLGLMLCREYVEQSGGSIGLESEEGVGSTFWFTLPVAVHATAFAYQRC